MYKLLLYILRILKTCFLNLTYSMYFFCGELYTYKPAFGNKFFNFQVSTYTCPLVFFSDWQRKEFLQLYLQTLDTSQIYLLYGFLMVNIPSYSECFV